MTEETLGQEEYERDIKAGWTSPDVTAASMGIGAPTLWVRYKEGKSNFLSRKYRVESTNGTPFRRLYRPVEAARPAGRLGPDEYREARAAGWLKYPEALASYGLESHSDLLSTISSRVYFFDGNGDCESFRRRLFQPIEVHSSEPSPAPQEDAPAAHGFDYQAVAARLRADAAELESRAAAMISKADAIEAALKLLAEVSA